MKSTRYSCDMLMKLKFSRQILEKSSNIKLIKIHAELFHVDGRTGMTKLIVAFRNFEKAIKNIQYFLCKIPSIQKDNLLLVLRTS